MAIGKYSDFQIYDEQFHSGAWEALEQETNAFNEASRNGIQLISQGARGHFEEQSFFKVNADMIKRRDISDTTDATDDPLESAELRAPKVNRKFQVANTLDSLRKITSSVEEFSFVLGQQAGKARAVDYLNTGLRAGVAAMLSNSGVQHDAGKNASVEVLIDGLSKYGDAASRIVLWASHSAPGFQLMKSQLDVETDRVAGATIYEASVGTLARRLLITDSPALVQGSVESPTGYYILGLTESGIALLESEDNFLFSGVVSGRENLIFRVQGEHAYNVRVNGYAYTHATENPNDDAIGTHSNWVRRYSDNKSTAGILIKVTA
jgi:hypothetical protein